jgi:hypothetical protein
MQFFSITVLTRSSVEAHRPSAARSAQVFPPVIPDMTTFEVSVHSPPTGSAAWYPPSDDAKPAACPTSTARTSSPVGVEGAMRCWRDILDGR